MVAFQEFHRKVNNNHLLKNQAICLHLQAYQRLCARRCQSAGIILETTDRKGVQPRVMLGFSEPGLLSLETSVFKLIENH